MRDDEPRPVWMSLLLSYYQVKSVLVRSTNLPLHSDLI